MGTAVKSLSVKIGADTSDFIKGMKQADKEINAAEKSAKELEKSLKIKYDPAKFQQTQAKYRQALEDTESKADSLRKQLEYLEKAGRVDTADYEKLNAELIKTESKVDQLKLKLDEISKIKVENLAKDIEKVGKGFEDAANKAKVFSAAAAGIIAGGVKLASDARKTGDEIGTLATKYDMSAEAIQRWQYVALQSDVETTVLYNSLKKLNTALGDQVLGTTNTATQALEQLGINAKNFANNDEAFAAIVREISKLGSATEQAAMASDIFGERYATELIPLFSQGEEAINSYLKEFETVGYLSNEEVAQLGALDNELNKVETQFNNAKIRLGEALIPVLEKFYALLEQRIIPAIEKFTEWFDNLDSSTQNTILTMLGVIALLAPTLSLIGKMTNGVAALVKIVGALGLTAKSAAIGFGAFAGALALGLNLIADWQNMSKIEKILKSLAVAALVAAGAVAVFQASWSLGIAIGAIAAGIVAAVAAINSASNKLGLGDVVDSSGASISDSGSAGVDTTNYDMSKYTTSSTNDYSTNNSNNVYNIEVEIVQSDGESAEDLAERVSQELYKKIATA